MVIEKENIAKPSNQEQNLNRSGPYHQNMDKKQFSSNSKLSKNEGENESSSKQYLEDDKVNNEVSRISSSSNNWWPNESEGGKLDSRQRWSFGSDISIEAVENIQSRLCCSPVDEFDSTVSSENEDLIVNSTDESYKNYIQVSPASSPTFKKVMCEDEKQNKNHDVDTADDELIDYSKRYTTDSSVSMSIGKHVSGSHMPQRQRNMIINTMPRHVPEKKNSRSKVDPFRDYAETDLDQPTDYSLRYAEEDTDEEEKENRQFYNPDEQEDTIKTYYTEGTPYETPCNFSTATSMSDLLSLEDAQGDEAYKRQFLKQQKQEALDKSEKVAKDCRNRVRRKYVSDDTKVPILEETSNVNHQQKNCERKSSCTPPQSPAETCHKDKGNKAVTFNTENNYAQETPLMFSRSSSLDSLSEFDQHSIQDDRSSVISDFSHRTSGAVSPSDLPDSPTQTVPPSPRRLRQQNFNSVPHNQKMPLRPTLRKISNPPNQTDDKIQHAERLPTNRELTYEKLNPIVNRGSIFEDGLVSFKEETMPSKGYLTRASSLSALTIDDEDGEECNGLDIMNKIASMKVRTSANGMHQAPTQKQYLNNSFNESNKSSQQPQQNKILNRHSDYINNCLLVPQNKEEMRFVRSPNVEEYENDYINNGYANNEVQNNRYRESKDHWYKNESNNENRNESNRATSRSPESKRSHQYYYPQKLEADEVIASDSIKIYCTEDTPTYVSPYGSHSNLSALSMLSMSDENLSYNSNVQEGEPRRSPYEEEKSSSRVEVYDTDEGSSDFVTSEDERCYEDEESSPNSRRRIDVSPFDSQVNLANFSLLCIEEEDEEEEEEEEINETDKSTRENSCAEEGNAASRQLSYDNSENSDFSDEDRKVLQECIKSGVSKVTRQRSDFNADEHRQLF